MNDMTVDIIYDDYVFEYGIGEEENIIYIIEDHAGDGAFKIVFRRDNLLFKVNKDAEKEFRDSLLNCWSINQLFGYSRILKRFRIIPNFDFRDVYYKIICENGDVISFCPYVLPNLHETEIDIIARNESWDLIYKNRAKLYLQSSDKCFLALTEKFGDNKIHMLVEKNLDRMNDEFARYYE